MRGSNEFDEFKEPYGEVEGAGWSSCERCPYIFVRGTHMQAYSFKVAHWQQVHQ
jgi:hypothetical protein